MRKRDEDGRGLQHEGGVGKTTLAVSLAWASAVRSSRRTLLWDLDGQAAATHILIGEHPGKRRARAVIEGDIDPAKLIVETSTPGLDLLPADASLHALDATFAELDRKKRLTKLLESLADRYERVILDCPPGLGPTGDQVLRSASIVVVPLIPSTLSRRAMAEVRTHLDREHKGRTPMLSVFNMVDRRRAGHLAALSEDPETPAIPMASQVEAMADRHAAIGAYAPRSPAAEAIARLWEIIEKRLAEA